MRNVVLVGDVREQLALLKDESVHCVVTSPPYWGLRDYGTAEWEGGDEGCEHKPAGKVRLFNNGQTEKLYETTLASWSNRDATPAAGVCGLCGARRIDKGLGLEPTLEEYVANMVEVFREVRRVLRRDGTVWCNLGDSYAGSNGTSGNPGDKQYTSVGSGGHRPGLTGVGLKPKDLVGIPWRVAFALQADGWWLRSDIIWSKPNPMPESVTDRPMKAHEYVFLLTKSQTYYYDAEAIREPQKEFIEYQRGPQASVIAGDSMHGGFAHKEGDFNATRQERGIAYNPAGRNKRTVWEIVTQPYSEAHFATYPQALVKPCVLAGTSEWGCCSVCGAPWKRVVEKDETLAESRRGTAGYESCGLEAGRRFGSETPGYTSIVRTTGWAPTCSHEAPVVPCTVLDPFLGSGTTALVAKTAGRDYIGIELNPAYAEMAKRRINVEQERLL